MKKEQLPSGAWPKAPPVTKPPIHYKSCEENRAKGPHESHRWEKRQDFLRPFRPLRALTMSTPFGSCVISSGGNPAFIDVSTAEFASPAAADRCDRFSSRLGTTRRIVIDQPYSPAQRNHGGILRREWKQLSIYLQAAGHHCNARSGHTEIYPIHRTGEQDILPLE